MASVWCTRSSQDHTPASCQAAPFTLFPEVPVETRLPPAVRLLVSESQCSFSLLRRGGGHTREDPLLMQFTRGPHAQLFHPTLHTAAPGLPGQVGKCP